MNKLLAALLLMLCACRISALDTLTALYEIDTAQGTFLQIPLSHDVYRFSQQANLDNLVVIDAQQNLLPTRVMAINVPDALPLTQTIAHTVAFFPVPADATAETLRKMHSTQTSIQGDKTQIITSEKTLDNSTAEFFLLDISKLEQAITRLIVDWDTTAATQYVEVKLEASQNLHDWRSLTQATLVQVNEQGQSLKHNFINIKIAQHEYPYLRLKILRGADKLKITGITAEHTVESTPTAKKPIDSWRLTGESAKIQTSVYTPTAHSKTYAVRAWEYTRNEATPAARLSVDLGEKTYGDSIRVFSRASATQNWQLQYQGIWFQTQVGAHWQKSDRINLRNNGDKFWRLELSPTAQNIATPELVFSWESLFLHVIANDKPPFKLALSRDNSNRNREQVFNRIISTANPSWIQAHLIPLNNAPMEITDEPQPIHWQRWLFWAALLFAVVILLAFSLRLFKQLSQQNTQQ
ncbi:MAG TPA: DUF3999 family protein [Cellvibrionaceae bacterium]